MDLDDVAAALRHLGDLRLNGIHPDAVRDRLGSGALVRIRRGWYADGQTWRRWTSEERVAARAVCTAASMRGGDVVASHTCALVLHGLPLWRVAPRRAHVTGPHTDGGVDRDGVARHRAVIAGEQTTVNGIGVTSLARTIADVIGRLPLEAAVTSADAALRRVAWRGTAGYNDAADRAFRVAVSACAALQPGARGCVQARWVLDFADGRAQLPGESVTRLLLHRIGFETPRLQVRLIRRGGRWYDVDFGLEDAGVWLEFDGTAKYTDPALRGGRSPLDVVLEEKRREDDIRGMTGRRVVRIGTEHLASLQALARRLADFGVRPAHPAHRGPVPPPSRFAL